MPWFTWLPKLKFWFKTKKNPRKDLPETFFEPEHALEPWWDAFNVPDAQSKLWKIGHLAITMEHFQQEWHLAHWYMNPHEEPGQSEESWMDKPSKTNLTTKTFIFEARTDSIALKPALPDRYLYSKLGKILYIPAYEQIHLYVISPVWIEIGISDLNLKLDAIPTKKLLDTWLGSNTWIGELCYAGHTFCTADLTKLNYANDSIITPLYIQNKSKHILSLDRATLPLPYLSIYQDCNNHLWTEQVMIVKEGNNDPDITITHGPPRGVPDIKLLTPPRFNIAPGNGLKTVFNILMGQS